MMRWNPFEGDLFQELRRTQRDFNRLLGVGSRGTQESPAFNVRSSDSSHVMTAVLPGIDAGSLDVSIVGDTVTVRGKYKDRVVPGSSCLRRERPMGEFLRSFRLPNTLDSQRAAAKYQNGILRLELPIAEAEKPRKIAIKST